MGVELKFYVPHDSFVVYLGEEQVKILLLSSTFLSIFPISSSYFFSSSYLSSIFSSHSLSGLLASSFIVIAIFIIITTTTTITTTLFMYFQSSSWHTNTVPPNQAALARKLEEGGLIAWSMPLEAKHKALISK